MENLLKRLKKRAQEDDLFTFIYRITRSLIIRVILFENFLSQELLKIKFRNRYIKKKILDNWMYLDPNDLGISYDLFRNSVREPFATEFFRKWIKEGDVIVDIGANIGYYVLQEARLVGNSGRVYAIEPVAENVELLQKNIELNNYSNVETFELAIGPENKVLPIYLTPLRNWNSMLKIKESESLIKKKTFVKTVTLDKFLENKPLPNIVRMDVEGYEVEIIKGMKALLSSGKPLKLFIEIHPHIVKEKIKDLLDTLKSFGFKLKKVCREPNPYLQCQPELIKKIINKLGKKIGIFDAGYCSEYNSIDDLLNDNELVRGEKGGLEIFLERN